MFRLDKARKFWRHNYISIAVAVVAVSTSIAVPFAGGAALGACLGLALGYYVERICCWISDKNAVHGWFEVKGHYRQRWAPISVATSIFVLFAGGIMSLWLSWPATILIVIGTSALMISVAISVFVANS